MSVYTRVEIVKLLGIDEAFLAALEREEIVRCDVETGSDGFSELMLERVRVAHNLVHELEVNLAGVSIILRMREQMSALHRELEELAAALRQRMAADDG